MNKFGAGKRNGKTKRIKRSSDSVNHDVHGFYNLSGDVFDVEYPEAKKLIFYDEKDEIPTEYNHTIVEELAIDVNSEEIGHFSGPKWQRTRSSSKINISLYNKECNKLRM